MHNLHHANTRLLDGFWAHYAKLNREVTVHSVYDRFAETGRFDALRCQWQEGQPNRPHIFWDSDVAKWLEAAAYLTETRREPALEAIVDEAVENIVRNQKPSGYFNSYYLTVEPGVEFQVRDNHELYCAGHLIEAAIAYDRATGKSRFLQAMTAYADYIYQVFYVEQRAGFVTPGHQEIELALLLLADYTGRERYRQLAARFIEQRGQRREPMPQWMPPPQVQSEAPARQLTEAKGHAVRACYYYTAMAMLARETNDRELLEVCRGLFRDITRTKLSITGGIGSNIRAEAFGPAFDLPSIDNYNETCAAIALAMFAGELQQSDADSIYGDLIEWIWYNGFLSGLSLSGKAFFYENVLEIDLRDYTDDPYASRSLSRSRLERSEVFSCSCCPPNITRMLASIPRYLYTVDGSTIYCNQFMSARTELTVNGKPAVLEQKTDYPSSGRLSFTWHGEPAVLMVRIPRWCVEYTGAAEGGFARFPVTDGQTVELELPMEIHFVEADPRVRANAGRCAVTRGPLVYCMEGVDNGTDLRHVELLAEGAAEVLPCEAYHAPVLLLDALRRTPAETLYRLRSPQREPMRAKLIPYFAFANRGPSDLQVWMSVR